ncbi:MAG: hypothetical protein JWO47_745 [Candidatus Saccharibacteria bacterium]|nr:hypothetical protein [Candidatus Saccharibacteria bacterium]
MCGESVKVTPPEVVCLMAGGALICLGGYIKAKMDIRRTERVLMKQTSTGSIFEPITHDEATREEVLNMEKMLKR